MTSWKRTTLVVFVLMGGTMTFSYWSFNQLDSAFDTYLRASSAADTLTASSFLKKYTDLASTSPEMATSTDEITASSGTPPEAVATTTTSTTTTATTTPKTSTGV